MSMPPGKIRCHGCSFEAHLAVRPVTLRYHLPDGSSVNGYRQFGWCHECATITDVEERLDPVDLEGRVAAATPKPTLFGRLFGASGGVSQAQAAELSRLSGQLRLARIRTSPPRCLRCGRTRVEHIHSDDGGNVVGTIHSCGKGLYHVPVDPDAPRFHYRPEVIHLDAEGRRESHDS
jgi:hypothetical protein